MKYLTSLVLAGAMSCAFLTGCGGENDAPRFDTKNENVDSVMAMQPRKKEREEITEPKSSPKITASPTKGATATDENKKSSPLEAFELHVARVQRELPTSFPITVHEETTMSGLVDLELSLDKENRKKLTYDVEATKSLVSPYIAYMTFPCEAHGSIFRKATSGSIMCRVSYAFQSDQWKLKSFEVEGISGIDFSPDETASIVKLEKEIACLALSRNLLHSKVVVSLAPQ
jgi:hypothetical protein